VIPADVFATWTATDIRDAGRALHALRDNPEALTAAVVAALEDE
jgi:hypothetical protein